LEPWNPDIFAVKPGEFFCVGALEHYNFLAQSPGALNPFGILTKTAGIEPEQL